MSTWEEALKRARAPEKAQRTSHKAACKADCIADIAGAIRSADFFILSLEDIPHIAETWRGLLTESEIEACFRKASK